MKKHSYAYVKLYFENNGCELLSKEYMNGYQKLDYICENGHKHSIEFRHFQSGHGCSKCADLEKSKRLRLNFDVVRNSFMSDEYNLLTTKYKNAHQYLHYVCPFGHENKMTWNNWHKGHRCPTCALINNSGYNHPNWKGGISCAPYCDAWADKEYKNSIKERDNYRCQNPYCWRTSKRLVVHHIDYNKKNCSPSNLITLCISCNARANFNTDYWQNIYSKIGAYNGR